MSAPSIVPPNYRVNIEVLQAAGLTDEQIAAIAPLIAELEQLREYRAAKREQNRKDKQKQRSRQADQETRQADRQADIKKPNGINGHVTLTNGESSSFFFLDSERKKETPKCQADDFDVFYAACPKRVGKIAAEKAYWKARKKATREELLAGIERYKRNLPDPQYIPHPASWLNQGRWLDEAMPAKRLSGVI